ncbi:6834_t:CDS:2, partial [Cetraspora pellucida]
MSIYTTVEINYIIQNSEAKGVDKNDILPSLVIDLVQLKAGPSDW